MGKKLGDLKPGDKVKLGDEKTKVTDVRRSGDRTAATLKGKGSRYEYSGGADEEIGE